LAEGVSLKDLQNEFGRFGNIIEIMIPVDYHTRMPKGYCFIEFEDFYQAEASPFIFVPLSFWKI
jgi:RNA recognition motif-containing protein